MSTGTLEFIEDGPQLIPTGSRGWRKCFVIDGVAWPVEKCRRCFADIALVRTAAGKRQPRDSDGRVHYVTCAYELQKRGQRHYKPPGQLKLF